MRTIVCLGCGKARVGHLPPNQRFCSRACRWPRSLVEADGGLAIPLYGPQNAIVGLALIDSCDANLAGRRWHLANSGYAAGRQGRMVLMHREILGLEVGDRRQADHINGARLDNRRSNLRIVTAAQNSQNRAPVGGSSKYRGVCFHKLCGRWLAYGNIGRKRFNLGLYDTEQEAARVARQWRERHMSHTNEART